MANSKSVKKSSKTKNSNTKSKTLNTSKKPSNRNTTKKKTTRTPKTTKNQPKKIKTTVSKTANGKKQIKKETVSTKTMEIKVPDLPKKKQVEIKQEEVKKTSFKDKINNIFRIEKKKKRKSNSKKISKNKKQSFKNDLNKLIRKIKMYGISSVISLKSLVTIGIMFLIIIFAIAIFFSFINGGSHIDLSNIPYEIDQLKTISYNMDDSEDIVASSEAYSNLKDYYTYDFENEFKLDASFVEDYVIKINTTKKEVFIVIKATPDHDQDVKQVFDTYLKENAITNYEYLPYQGYQFYIASSNNKVVISKIRQSQIRVFDALKELRKEDIKEDLGISPNLYDEALVKRAVILSKNTGYYIFNATNNSNAKKINKLLNKYFTNLEKEYKDKNISEYNLIKNRYSKISGNTCIYVISYDNDLVKELLKN